MCWKVTPEISSVLTFKRRRRFQAKKDDHDKLDGNHDELDGDHDDLNIGFGG